MKGQTLSSSLSNPTQGFHVRLCTLRSELRFGDAKKTALQEPVSDDSPTLLCQTCKWISGCFKGFQKLNFGPRGFPGATARTSGWDHGQSTGEDFPLQSPWRAWMPKDPKKPKWKLRWSSYQYCIFAALEDQFSGLDGMMEKCKLKFARCWKETQKDRPSVNQPVRLRLSIDCHL